MANGEPSSGLIGLVRQAISALPPGFLMVAILMLGFLGVVTWLIDSYAEHRLELIKSIIERCLPAVR